MTVVIGHLLALWALILLMRFQDINLSTAVTWILGVAYVLLLRVSRKTAYLYTGTILCATGYFLLLSRYSGLSTTHLFSIPLIAVLYGLGLYYASRKPDYSKSLFGVAHCYVLFITGLILVHNGEVNSIVLMAASLTYVLIYALLYRFNSNSGSVFGAAALFSIFVFFGLNTFSFVNTENHLSYFVFLSPLFTALAFLLQSRGNLKPAYPIYGVAILIPLLSGASALYSGHLESARIILFTGAVIYMVLLALFKKHIYSYLLTLSFGMIIYSFLQDSQSHFTQHLVIVFLYLLLVLGLFFLWPYLKKMFATVRSPLILTITDWKGTLFYSIPLSAIVLIIIILYGLKASDHPAMCNSCHQMKTYYESWENSAHKDIKCIACHYEPGLEGKMKGKMTGAVSLTKYLSELYGPKPRTEVPNSVCLQPGCHKEMDMDAEIVYKNEIKFMHSPHNDQIVREKQLRCTTCHSYILKGEHFTVANNVCFICHFMEGEDDGALNDCYLCHGPPKEAVAYNGSEFIHTDFMETTQNVECTDCHIAVTVGDGAVPTQACLSCHQEEVESYTDHVLIHNTHITEHKIECFECHTQIKHGLKRMVEEPALDCDECHRKRHSVPEQMYRGTGGKGVEDYPDPMFEVNVVCEACHKYESDLTDAGDITFHVRTASVQACADCHGEGYDEMGREWQDETKAGISDIESLLKRGQEHVRSLKGSVSAESLNEAERLLARAESNYYFVVADKSFGIHNFMYTTNLLEKVREDLDECMSIR